MCAYRRACEDNGRVVRGNITSLPVPCMPNAVMLEYLLVLKGVLDRGTEPVTTKANYECFRCKWCTRALVLFVVVLCAVLMSVSVSVC